VCRVCHLFRSIHAHVFNIFVVILFKGSVGGDTRSRVSLVSLNTRTCVHRLGAVLVSASLGVGGLCSVCCSVCCRVCCNVYCTVRGLLARHGLRVDCVAVCVAEGAVVCVPGSVEVYIALQEVSLRGPGVELNE